MSRWLWIWWAVALCVMSARLTCAAETPPIAGSPSASAGMVAQPLVGWSDRPGGGLTISDDAPSKHAVADGAAAIVLRLDTPGRAVRFDAASHRRYAGLQGSGAGLCGARRCARAASAGTYILYAGQIAAMAPATVHVGAVATPASLAGSTPMPFPKIGDQPASAEKSSAQAPSAESGDTESHKVLNDSIAYIRSLAQLRERNVEWAEQAAGMERPPPTAAEAAEQHVIDFVATDV